MSDTRGSLPTIRIAGVSDLHGHLSHSIPQCDVLCIVGDIVPLYSSAEDWRSQQELDWIKKKLMRWLKRQPYENCVIVPGNHDICMFDPMTRDETRETLLSGRNVHVLDDRQNYTMISGFMFSGHPWTPTIQNRNWAFSQARSSEGAQAAAELIHSGTDVLLSHGPPQGILDTQAEGRRCGCANLMHRMLEVGPRLTLCGHIHTQRGKRSKWFDRNGRENTIINVSICDDGYTPRGAKVQTYDLELTPA